MWYNKSSKCGAWAVRQYPQADNRKVVSVMDNTVPHHASDDNPNVPMDGKAKPLTPSARYAAKPENKAKQREYNAKPESREKARIRAARYGAKPETKVKKAERHARKYKEDPAYKECIAERHAAKQSDPAYRAQRHENYLNYISTPEGREKKREYNARYREQKREYDAALRAKIQADPQLRAERNAKAAADHAKKMEDPEYRARIVARDKAYRAKNASHERDQFLVKKYNMTHKDYEAMYSQQNGCCAICRRYFEKLHIDHDHKSGVVRALLCLSCNAALGLFKEDTSALQRAIAYLEFHNEEGT